MQDGIVLSQYDLKNNHRDDPGNSILASKIRQRALFCDFMLHLMMHANLKTDVVFEWVMTTTTSRCLKDSHTSSTGMDYLSNLFIPYSYSSAVDTLCS